MIKIKMIKTNEKVSWVLKFEDLLKNIYTILYNIQHNTNQILILSYPRIIHIK